MARGFTSIKAARLAVSKTPASAVPFHVKLENVNGKLRYVPRFLAVNEGQKDVIKRCGFECLERGAQG